MQLQLGSNGKGSLWRRAAEVDALARAGKIGGQFGDVAPCDRSGDGNLYQRCGLFDAEMLE